MKKTKKGKSRCKKDDQSKKCVTRRCVRKQTGLAMSKLKRKEGEKWNRKQAIAVALKTANKRCYETTN